MPFFNHRTVKSTNMSKRRRSKDTDLPGQRAGIPPFVAARSEPFFECNAFFGDSDVKFVKIHTKKKKIFFDISGKLRQKRKMSAFFRNKYNNILSHCTPRAQPMTDMA